jgi:D-alanyl-D-alanine carboxypeptidase
LARALLLLVPKTTEIRRICSRFAEAIKQYPAFAELMNQQAQRLGMHSTHFMNATGLPVPDQHYTTARDLALLTRAVIKEFPEYYRWDSVKEFTFNNITQKNRTILLWRDESVDSHTGIITRLNNNTF